MSERIKNFGWGLGGIIFIAALAILGGVILYGVAEASVWALDWTTEAFGFAFIFCLIFLLPLAIIPATRGLSGNGLYLASYLLA